MAHVFISYDRQDSEVASRLATALRNDGVSVWLDTDHLIPGVDFRHEIRRAIKDASCVVVLWSSTSVTSPWVLDEAKVAYADDKPLLTLRIADVDPPMGFGTLHAAHWDGNLDSDSYRTLKRTIKNRFPEVLLERPTSETAKRPTPVDEDRHPAPDEPEPEDSTLPFPLPTRRLCLIVAGAILLVFLAIAAVARVRFESLVKDMVLIPAGTYSVGYSPEDPLLRVYMGLRDEPHPVYFYTKTETPDAPAPFLLDAHEVTCEEYAEFLRSDGVDLSMHLPAKWDSPDEWDNPSLASQPVVGVTARSAKAYAAWKGKRLPTWHEWIWASLWSTGGYSVDQVPLYPLRRAWGIDELPGEHVNYRESGRMNALPVDAAGVGEFAGIFGQFGNVSEIVVTSDDTALSAGGHHRASWEQWGIPWLAFYLPSITSYSATMGFRCALDAPDSGAVPERMVRVPASPKGLRWVPQDRLVRHADEQDMDPRTLALLLNGIEPQRQIELESGYYLGGCVSY